MSTILNNKHGGFVTSFEVTNFSSAKQKFSFGKGPRFSKQKNPETELVYNLPNAFNRRAPSFGIGERFDALRESRNCLLLFMTLHPITFAYRQPIP